MKSEHTSKTTGDGLRRRDLAALAVATCLPGWALAQTAQAPAGPLVQVWKDPNCGCCKDWMAYLEKNGFRTQTFDTGNTAMRGRLGMPQKFGSCHTALVGGFTACSRKSRRPWACRCRACQSARRAWMVPSTVAARTPTRCC